MAREASKTFYKSNGDRAGFVQKRINQADPARTVYGVGIDGGNPNRGIMDREINTPLGSIGYGYDGDTSYANVSPAMYANYVGGDEPTAWAGYGDYQLRASKWNTPTTPNYAVGLNLPDNMDVIPDFYKSVNTPVGRVGVGSNDGNPGVYGEFQPNAQTQYYLQALANLLSR